MRAQHCPVLLQTGALSLAASEGACVQIFEYNGSAIIAMSGKECVAIASDLRLGQ